MHKTSSYVKTVVTLHNLRDRAKEAVEALQEKSISERINEGIKNTRRTVAVTTRNFFTHPETEPCQHIPQNYGYIFRQKSRWELVLLSGTVCGIEFCYAAETAFVTPVLLSLGLSIKFVTMIWCLSPLIGFFLTPILGSLSDTCESKYGRRRPFILLLSMGILFGLIFVPNGRHIGAALGDKSYTIASLNKNDNHTATKGNISARAQIQEYLNPGEPYREAKSEPDDGLKFSDHFIRKRNIDGGGTNNRELYLEESSEGRILHPALLFPSEFFENGNKRQKSEAGLEGSSESRIQHRGILFPRELTDYKNSRQKRELPTTNYMVPRNASRNVQPWSITFTVLGTVLLDFCSDACQSPSRTYLLDVCIPDDHPAGLSSFTMMAGLGGSMGYLMGTVNWEATAWGKLLGGQVNAVFTLVTIIFVICLLATICSFPEIPLSVFRDANMLKEYQEKSQIGKYEEKGNELVVIDNKQMVYGATSTSLENPAKDDPDIETNDAKVVPETGNEVAVENPKSPPCELPELDSSALPTEQPTLKEYLRSIIRMPPSLRILCLTNLFCWMSLVCYSLYFTDFVGECVYGGDPQAPEDSEIHMLYKDGVRFGCWGMALYSLSCSVYSYFIEALVKRFGAKSVYIGGQLVYSGGMVIMALARHPAAVILLSPTAGVMYSTLFTMPYLLIAHYHCTQQFREDRKEGDGGVRGIGTDVAAVSSMVFLSQFILSLTMGSIVEAVGSNVVPVCAASILSACGAMSATQVMYLDI